MNQHAAVKTFSRLDFEMSTSADFNTVEMLPTDKVAPVTPWK